jgi:predicted N-acetyltransferase YhbS
LSRRGARPRWWQAAGFAPLADYYSTATPDLAARDARVAKAAARLAADGVAIRPVDLTHFDEELARIHEVSVVSFQSNFLYTPLPREEFVAQYRDVKKCLRPELLLLAERAGRPVGYVFALPDLMAPQRGQPVTSIIVKTLSVLPGRAQAGLGAVLLAEVHAVAARLGYRRAIHTLMHEANPSRNLSAHYAGAIRRYTLFARRLTSA